MIYFCTGACQDILKGNIKLNLAHVLLHQKVSVKLLDDRAQDWRASNTTLVATYPYLLVEVLKQITGSTAELKQKGSTLKCI